MQSYSRVIVSLCVRTCSTLFFRCFWPTHYNWRDHGFRTPLRFVEYKKKRPTIFLSLHPDNTPPDPDKRKASDNNNFDDYEIHDASSTIGFNYGEEHDNATSALHPFFFSRNFLRT
jgi:hypothetical protein